MQSWAAEVDRMMANVQKACAEITAWEGRVLHARDLRSLAALTASEAGEASPAHHTALHPNQRDPGHSSEAAPGPGLSCTARRLDAAGKLPSPDRGHGNRAAGASSLSCTARRLDAAGKLPSQTPVPGGTRSNALEFLDTLQEEAMQASGSALVPRGNLVYSPVVDGVIERPVGVRLVPELPSTRRVKNEANRRVPTCGCHDGAVSRLHKALETLPLVSSRAALHEGQMGGSKNVLFSRPQSSESGHRVSATGDRRVLPMPAKYLPAWQNVSAMPVPFAVEVDVHFLCCSAFQL
jgi:hypothetical protein